MERVPRKVLLRVASAYHTTCTVVLQVITCTAPIEHHVEERTYVPECVENKKKLDD